MSEPEGDVSAAQRPRCSSWPLRCILALTFMSSACGGGAQREREAKAQYHAELAYGYLVESSDPNAALQEALKSLKAHEANPNTHNIMSLIFMARADWLKALKHAKRAVELKPDLHDARNNLGVIYLSLGQWQEALKVFETLTTTLEYRTPARAYNNLGWALFKLNRPEEAKRAFTTATKLNPRLCPPYNNLGLVSLELNELELAERSLKRALSACPTYVEPLLHLAELHVKRGDDVAAVESLRRCVELGGDSELGLRCASALERAPQEVLSAP